MKEYICLQELNNILDKRIAEERITARILSDVGRGVELASIFANSLPKVTEADVLHEFKEWYASHCDFSEVQLDEFKHKWKRWIEDFISEKERERMIEAEKATQEFKEKLNSGYFSLGKECDTAYEKELINVIESLDSERDGARRMSDYSFVEVMNARTRMCESFKGCGGCPLSGMDCRNLCDRKPEQAQEIIMKWAKEHPLKTNADKFKEVFGFEHNHDCPMSGSNCCNKNSVCYVCEYYEFWQQEYKERGE